jgi:diacylglycerol kinase
MRIDPKHHAAETSPGRWISFLHALAGILYALRHQRNTWIMGVATVVMVVLGVWLEVSGTEWAILVLATGLVWVAEFLNSAIEAAVDLASPEVHPAAKVAKDVAAGAVLTAAVVAFVVALIVLLPPALDQL